MGRQARRGGGLLAKIFGKSNPARGIPGLSFAPRAAGQSGGFLQSIADPASINGFLNNTQNVLKAAQTFGPMVQQYGPLVRNLPSMWKLYRGLKDLPDAENQEDAAEDVKVEAKAKTEKAEKKLSSSVNGLDQEKKSPAAQKRKSIKPKVSKQSGIPLPKLYV
ncbi:YqfQ family protein [Bacillus massilinigeriensis]|uniref:YqfQ family protein n=1 Tax=Bacillus mediterraneensis TaxID=1805474 RepID=UPI001F1D2A43|nr:YqfQ family protein [Bacillus mediterraneensis]